MKHATPLFICPPLPFLFCSRKIASWILAILICALVPSMAGQPASTSSSASRLSNDSKFEGPPADLRALGAAFSSNTSFRVIELSGEVSRPFNLDARPAPFVITVQSDGTTEMRIKTNAGDYWERYSTVGSLGTCSSSMNRPDQSIRSALRCSSPVSWVLPAATLQSSDWTMRLKSARQIGTDDKKPSLMVTLWIGNSSNKSISDDPLKRYTARQLTIDRVSQLPSSLRYELAPVGPVAATYSPPSVEIRYSDYRNVSGYNIPFRIDKLLQDQVQSSFTVENVSVR